MRLYTCWDCLTKLPPISTIDTRHESLHSQLTHGVRIETTYRHRLIRTSRLHLVIGTFPLLTPRTLECVGLCVGLANSLGIEKIVFCDLLVHCLDAFRGHVLLCQLAARGQGKNWLASLLIDTIFSASTSPRTILFRNPGLPLSLRFKNSDLISEHEL